MYILKGLQHRRTYILHIYTDKKPKNSKPGIILTLMETIQVFPLLYALYKWTKWLGVFSSQCIFCLSANCFCLKIHEVLLKRKRVFLEPLLKNKKEMIKRTQNLQACTTFMTFWNSTRSPNCFFRALEK